MPISFSALCIISCVMRSGGVGEGDGVCASALSGRFVAAKPVAPSSFTKVRRLTFVLRGFLVFFMVVLAADECGSFIHGHHCSCADAWYARSSVFQLYDFCFTKAVDRDDIEVVVFTFGDDGVSLAAQL